jgi:hypothetical protein
LDYRPHRQAGAPTPGSDHRDGLSGAVKGIAHAGRTVFAQDDAEAARRTSAADFGLGDASLRWGRLWRQGIPYSTLLSNAINHPNAPGMKLFADSLMTLFL